MARAQGVEGFGSGSCLPHLELQGARVGIVSGLVTAEEYRSFGSREFRGPFKHSPGEGSFNKKPHNVWIGFNKPTPLRLVLVRLASDLLGKSGLYYEYE